MRCLERPGPSASTIECAGPDGLDARARSCSWRAAGRGHARPVLPLPAGAGQAAGAGDGAAARRAADVARQPRVDAGAQRRQRQAAGPGGAGHHAGGAGADRARLSGAATAARRRAATCAGATFTGLAADAPGRAALESRGVSLPPDENLRVGGAVRDRLLGLPVTDRDWVVVGATRNKMLAPASRRSAATSRSSCTRRPSEEYALARTERKIGAGLPRLRRPCRARVTLEEDLARRDLTINAMARGRRRHADRPATAASAICSAACCATCRRPSPKTRCASCALARFAARFADFAVAPRNAGADARRWSAAGEVDALVPERVWQELSRGLMEAQPSPHVRGAARLRRAGARCCPRSTACGACRSRAEHHPESTPACT